MRRIHLTAQDLAQTRLKTTVGAIGETVFALDRLRGSGTAPYDRWHRHVSKRLRTAPDLGRLLNGSTAGARELDHLLSLVDRAKDGSDFVVQALRPEHRAAARGLLELWRIGIAPHWPRILRHLEADCESRGRIVMTGGIQYLLATLHPRIVWQPPVLSIPGPSGPDVALRGQGLVLSPSVFLSRDPAQLIGAEQHASPAALVFAAAPPPPEMFAGTSATDANDEPRDAALAALVGQTRAAALRTLRASCTTTELAARLGISAAGVSKHTGVLRRTGLITTRRLRNEVLHTVTPLGIALLDGTSR